MVGASNQWFSKTLSALAVPRTGESELAAKVAEHWEQIEGFPRNVLAFARSAVPALLHFGAWTDDELWAAMEAHRAALAGQGDPGEGEEGYVDLRTEEWEVFSAARHPDRHAGLRPAPAGRSLPRYRTSSTTSCRPSGCARPARWSGSAASTPPTPRTPTSSRSPR